MSNTLYLGVLYKGSENVTQNYLEESLFYYVMKLANENKTSDIVIVTHADFQGVIDFGEDSNVEVRKHYQNDNLYHGLANHMCNNNIMLESDFVISYVDDMGEQWLEPPKNVIKVSYNV